MEKFKYVIDLENKKHGEEVEIVLPIRADEGSAGYDFVAVEDIVVPAMKYTLTEGTLQVLPDGNNKAVYFTDIKCDLEEDEVLILTVRSSMGIKKGLYLLNTMGVVDASYFNNPDNEGNIGFFLGNAGTEDIVIKKGERFAQGIIVKYIADSTKPLNTSRQGGFGSSGR